MISFMKVSVVLMKVEFREHFGKKHILICQFIQS